MLGYGLSTIAKPFLYFANSWGWVLGVRFSDRAGKGIRTSPRDALISASVEPRAHGAAFGLHRAMDHAGAVLGPLLAAGFLALVSSDLRVLFWLTAIPGAAAILVVWLGVTEAAVPERDRLV